MLDICSFPICFVRFRPNLLFNLLGFKAPFRTKKKSLVAPYNAQNANLNRPISKTLIKS